VSGFHPALTGVLYGALAQHEQALMQMQLAANLTQVDVDAETAERYTAIVDGLKRMIKASEPSGYDASTIGVTEEIQRRHALLGSILSQLLDFKVGTCTISTHYGQGIQVNMPFTHKSRELDVRAAMREIAQRLDLQYCERRHGTSDTTLHIEASGQIQGIDVEIYELINAERPLCDTHGVMVDDAGACPECPAKPPAGDHLVDADEHDPEPDATDDGVGRYADDQLAGMACAGCGDVFAENAPQVRVGHTFPGGGVVTDLGLRAHPGCVDSSIPELGDAP
jgi:hypothetical protein